jgi:hypothetical protein
MSTLPDPVPAAQAVSFDDDSLVVDLADGRRIGVPLAWFPRLLHATKKQRARFELLGGGEGIHWPDLDEDISVEGLLMGIPSRETGRTAKAG